MPETRKRRLTKKALTLLVLGGTAWFFIRQEEAPVPVPPASPASQSPSALAPPRPHSDQERISPEDMPAPFGDRMIQLPEPGAPPPSQTASLCSDENENRMRALVSRGSGQQFVVDSVAWRSSLTSTRAGIASWVSLCEGDGGAIDIVASGSGLLLATYHTQTGLHEY